jgi:hypothetical protein
MAALRHGLVGVVVAALVVGAVGRFAGPGFRVDADGALRQAAIR